MAVPKTMCSVSAKTSRFLFRSLDIFCRSASSSASSSSGMIHSRRSNSTYNWKSRDSSGLKTVNIDGLTVSFELYGRGSKVLLCNPGFLSTGSMQFGQLAELLKEDVTCVLWTPPLHDPLGNLRKLSGPASSSKLVTDADLASKLMKKIGIDHYHVFGFSNSSVAAAILAAKEIEHVESLILASAPFSYQDTSINSGISENCRVGLHLLSKRKIPKFEVTRAFIHEVGADLVMAMFKDFLDFVQEELATGDVTRIMQESYKKTEIPILVFQGADDRYDLIKHVDKLRSFLPRSEFVEVPGGDHDIYAYPDKIAPAIRQFLLNPSTPRLGDVRKTGVMYQ